MSSSPRQTLSYLRNTLADFGVRPNARLGQSFLIDLNLQAVLIDQAVPGPSDLVFEVGAGTGALTRLLCDRAGWVVAIELDPSLYLLAEDNTRDADNLDLVRADILASKNRLNPTVVETIEQRLQEHGLTGVKLIANLPYCVATPVIMNTLLSDLPMLAMSVTVQEEVADRLQSPPGKKSYAAVSVLMQTLARVEVFRRLPPQVFWPRPKVSSAMVHIVPDPERRRAVGDVHQLRQYVRRLFTNRRQGIRRVLKSQFRGEISVETLDAILADLAIDSHARIEQLAPCAVVALVHRLAAV